MFRIATIIAVSALSAFSVPVEQDQPSSQGGNAAANTSTAALPPDLVIPAGTFMTVRVDQPLSSDRSQPRETFTVTLTQPIVVDGLVVARRGQTLAGRVAEAQKAGRKSGQSRLGIELIELGTVDGQQLPIRTQLIEYTGRASKGRDATVIGATTGTGAAIGAAAAGGAGGGAGAAAGAVASTIGVLLTRGRATEIYPENVLTFRTLEPVTFSTERSAQAFQPVQQGDYAPDSQAQLRPGARPNKRAYPFFPFYYGFRPHVSSHHGHASGTHHGHVSGGHHGHASGHGHH